MGTTITGTLDEAITEATAVADLDFTVLSVLSHRIDLNIPISYSPGLEKGDLKIVAGPAAKNDTVQAPIDVDVKGTIRINDASPSEIACLSIRSDSHADSIPGLPFQVNSEIPVVKVQESVPVTTEFVDQERVNYQP